MIRTALCRCGACAIEGQGEPTVSTSDALGCDWLHLPGGWEVRPSAS